MSFYELIITTEPNEEPIIINVGSMHGISSAISNLDSAAKAGLIENVHAVDLFESVRVNASVLRELLKNLNKDTSWLQADSSYSVYLSEM